MTLRYYQDKAHNAIEDGLDAGINRQLLCMATGTGKTEVFSTLPERLKHKLPGQMLILVHRDELAIQAVNKLTKRNPDKNIHIDAGNLHANTSIADVIVGSVQTLGRKGTKRLDHYNWQNFDKYVVDEAHRSIADSYYNVYNAANLLKDNDPRLLLGVTATPTRGDGQGLARLYQKIVYNYPLRQAIEDGYLVDIRGIRVNTEISLDDVKTTYGDFNEDELAKEVDNPYRNNLVASAYVQHCEGRQALGFGVNIQHSYNLANAFKNRGINAEYVYGADPDRKDKIERFRNGDIQVLFNAQLLTEGFDMAEIECVILAAPTKSGVVFSQRIGRGTRLPEGLDNLHNLMIEPEVSIKTDCIVLDVCDSTSRHSLITLPTLLGLPSGLNMRGQSLVGTCKAIEKVLEEYPHLDFSTLKDADKIEAFVQDVNLFEVKFPPEVEQNTKFIWHPAFTGGYVLMLPEKDEVRITQNLLDIWEIRAKIKGKKYKGERNSVEEAFSAADKLIVDTVPESIKIIKREASWHNDLPTDKQLKALKNLYKGKQIPKNLTKGEATKLIGAAIANKG